MDTIPRSKPKLTQDILTFLRQAYNDPVVEITEVQPNQLRIRVGQDRGGPRYYNVKVTQEV